MNLKKIEGKEIAKMHFLPNDVLPYETQRTERNSQLITGMILGNLNKEESQIAIHTVEGDVYIESIIFAVTDKYVCLKGGVTILIASILEVLI